MYAQNQFAIEITRTLHLFERNITLSDCGRSGDSSQFVLFVILLDSSGGISKVNYLSLPNNSCQEQFSKVSLLIKNSWHPTKSNFSTIIVPLLLYYPEGDIDIGNSNSVAEKLSQFFRKTSEQMLLKDVYVSKPIGLTYYSSQKINKQSH